MNILNEELLENQNKLIEFLTEFDEFIELNIKVQDEYKQILLCYTNKIVDIPTENLEGEKASIDSILEFLNKIQSNLHFLNNNMVNLQSIKNKKSNIMQNPINIDELNDFVIEYNNLQKSISKNNIEINKFMNYAAQFINLCFSVEKELKENKKNNSDALIQESNAIKINESVDNNKYVENTLIISEIQGKVLLPFTLKELDNILNDNSNNYQNYDEIIENIYTIPYSEFRNPFITRFKEAFKLVKDKEHKSIKEAFELGMELIFNYNLHPAIIAACRNIDELDIYLDCLDNSETDKFDCFKVKFEIAPTLVNQK